MEELASEAGGDVDGDGDGGGAPAWITTFADLMSLLMCFFVLLLSFAEMDLNKFKAISGSLRLAFGVQREIKAPDTPVGTSLIAQEFSAGRPQPTAINEVRQSTMDRNKQTLEFIKSREEVDAEDPNDNNGEAQPGAVLDIPEPPAAADKETLEFADALAEADKQTLEFTDALAEEGDRQERDSGSDTQPDEFEQTVADAQMLMATLDEEIAKGIIQIETAGASIIIRIRETASFPSGGAQFRSAFLPVIAKLRTALGHIDGTIVIAGHTDNVPIKTARFRSNWELSAARAVSVVHKLLENTVLLPARFVVEGHGDAHPLAPNDSAENRALNRRVEMIIHQGHGDDVASEEPLAILMMPAPTVESAPQIDGVQTEQIDSSDEPGIIEQSAPLESAL